MLQQGLDKISIDQLFSGKGISLSILRLDKLHPVISGNKLFKLHYFIENALQSAHKRILSFGGAYSNHLVATAYASNQAGLQSIGVVRGEKPACLSHTLQQCMAYNMQLKFISRQAYQLKEEPDFIATLVEEFGECILIPEGGYHPLGAEGAARIMDIVKDENYSHICTATGTCTTLAGLLIGAKQQQHLIAVNVLKGMVDTIKRIEFLTGMPPDNGKLTIINGYHFGGYAKKTPELIDYMNFLWKQYQLPTDFVYTAKLVYAIMNKIHTGYFAEGSNILLLHTGGLQGNQSLPAGTLIFE
jgi:1-aminocyclopropane-1-carboxylate deaminase/D-cysteine desulfhydrase-like pyridoxal-dependent ACC family enzyme